MPAFLVVAALAMSNPAPLSPSTAKSAPVQILRREAPPKWAWDIQVAVASGRYDDARLLIDAQLKQHHTSPELANLRFLRSVSDAGLRDIPSLRKDAAEALHLAGESVALQSAYFWIGSQVDPDLALSSLERLAVLNADVARSIDEGRIWHLGQAFYQGHRMAEYNRLILVLADLSYGKVRPADEVQEKAAAILLERGEVQRAMGHARKITGRDSLINVLTDRRFETLWPELERASGDKLEVPAKARLAGAQAKFKAEPDSLEVRLDLMQAYIDLGLLSEADKLGAEVGRNLEELMTLGETTAYVIDKHAEILAMLGRPEEADARRAALVATWTRDRRWVINMAINRLAALFTMRKYQQILDELDKPGNRYQEDSSAYAKQLLRVLRISSLVQLGRRAEARALLPDLRSHEDDAPAATIDALLISGLDAEAEKSARAYLNDPDKRDTIIQSLRVADRAVKSDDPLADEMHRRFRARPALEAAFELYARDLPERFRRAN